MRHKNTEPAERERQRLVYTVTVDDFSNRAEYDVLDVHCLGTRQSAYIRANRFGRDVDLRARSFAR